MSRRNGITAQMLRTAIRSYQIGVSPFLRQRCRFFPTCSTYALEALDQWGSLRGLALIMRRLCKCHPWHTGGLDPVPRVQGSCDDPGAR